MRVASPFALLLCAASGTGLCSQQREQAPLPQRVREALEKARPALIDHLARSQGGQRALLVLAAIHDDVPRDNRIFEQALHELTKDRFTGTYELAVRLMVMAELESYPNRPNAAREDTQRLLMNQCDDGGFSYASGRSSMDLSNTQYGALGMRAAVALGQRVETVRWRRLLQLASQVQDASGGFSYTRGGAPYASMTVAGIGILEIGRQHLAAEAPKSDFEKRLEHGWKWMDRNVAAIGRSSEAWSSYFHYGLERAAILSDKAEIGGKDWYALGAEMLIKEQLTEGGWALGPNQMLGRTGRRSDLVDTAFAILFLNRKFQKVAGPITPSRNTPVSKLTAQATDAEIEKAVAYDALRAKQAVPELLLALRSEVLAQRKGAILALFRIAGDDFGYQPFLKPAAQEASLARAEAWWREAQQKKPGR